MYDIEIIIPAYKAEKTLERTIKSITNQITKCSFEVLISNDDPDSSYSNIINKYKNKIKIREIKCKNNNGPGIARQRGIDNSDSKYILFIDADDYLYDENSLEILYSNIEDNDLLISNFRYERGNKIEIKEEDPIWLHGKLYRRKFLRDNHIKFNNTRSNEDNGFNRLIMFLEPKIKIINKLTYVYAENENSITRRNNGEFDFYGLEGYTYNMYWAIIEAKKRKANKTLISEFEALLIVRQYFYYLEFYNHKEKNRILNWTKKLLTLYKKDGINYKLENKYINHYKEILSDTVDTSLINFKKFLKYVMDSREIDIIIPFYNSNSTLEETISTICNQDIKDNILITIVDDASEESPLEIINKYKRKIKIKYLKLEKNMGSGFARQYGINNTNGNYISFIDADDILPSENSISLIYNEIIKGYNHVAGLTYYEIDKDIFFNRSEVHGKMYKRDFLKEKNIKFNNTRFHEDNAFNNIVMINSPEFELIYNVVYVYKNNLESITSVSKEKEFERLEILIENIRYVLNETKKNKCNEKEIRFFIWEKFKYLNKFCRKISNNKKNIIKSWLKKYNIEYYDYLEYKNLNLLKKEIMNNYKI